MKSFRIFIVSFVLLGILMFLFFYNSAAGHLIHGLGNWLRSFSDSSFNYGAYEALKLENAGLKLEIEKIKSAKEADSPEYLTAMVYSRYPFNDRSTIVLNLGSADGVTTTMPVLAAKNILAGKILSVKKTQSEVQTIFDPAWRSAVAVGEKRAKAVLAGGNPPYLDFVPKDSPIKVGDEIYNISAEFPLDISLGTVLNLDIKPQNPWIKAQVKMSYNPEDLDKAMILKNFP
jgi:cell shape-determining protein MreC